MENIERLSDYKVSKAGEPLPLVSLSIVPGTVTLCISDPLIAQDLFEPKHNLLSKVSAFEYFIPWYGEKNIVTQETNKD